MSMDNETANSLKTEDKPWLWKKGQSGNLSGRPKGKSMKDYVREYLSKMTDEERDGWLEGINKIDLFKMAEGNPDTKNDNHIEGTLSIIMEKEINDKYADTSSSDNSKG